jgi:type IV pilus biogenesis protein PilP
MRPLVEASIAVIASVIAMSATAQTIAEYSHAQRTLLEAGMAQAAARMAALGASSVEPAASAPSTPARALETRRMPSAIDALIGVDGVFDAGARRLAEVSVGGCTFLLAAGQDVPGTAWHVEDITIDRVVLARQVTIAGEKHPSRITTRSFALPALALSGAVAP